MRPLNSRHRDPALERGLPGAALLFEACALVDASVDAAVAAARAAGRPCPFLLVGACAVYAVRPLAGFGAH